MNRDEKNLMTKQKIIDAALQEFSEKRFAEASMNTICSTGKISKGIIYHYFKDKDELYLVCVKACFDNLTGYMEEHMELDSDDMEENLQKYFDVRINFFAENPLYLKIFCSAVITPPAHLATDISDIRKAFDDMNIRILTSLLNQIKLRPGFTVDEVIHTFRLFQDFVNTRYQMQTVDYTGIQQHENQCKRILNLLLYGVADRRI
ncbi:TetR/AcrR family transcriptional regulator [Clostridium sp. chh4-2]|uniref:TetR/AcrR family transcriptional regulator n=1 Tax=Clostridium sp. chh4-2 TaxID=2067550 RepID=UPI000CCE2789|nr:TetR/AcrR family transcriptional regulator [Clostridium sp. chh4-2]PNV60805.1 TetR/AcrR family transcriptional regulator [Clostridium sp. chh4-2]